MFPVEGPGVLPAGVLGVGTVFNFLDGSKKSMLLLRLRALSAAVRGREPALLGTCVAMVESGSGHDCCLPGWARPADCWTSAAGERVALDEDMLDYTVRRDLSMRRLNIVIKCIVDRVST